MNNFSQKIVNFLHRYKIKPSELSFYEEALTHPSYSLIELGKNNYERMEFLGDALISFFVARFLYGEQNLTIGAMTRARIMMTKADTQADLANDLGLMELIRFNTGDPGILDSINVAADVFEAFCGAIYLDQGPIVLKNFLELSIFRKWNNGSIQDQATDYKTLLNDRFPHNSKSKLIYETTFDKDTNSASTQVWQHGKIIGYGKGRNKMQAEKVAAKNAFNHLFPQKLN